MTERCEIAVIGSGFAGSLMARVLGAVGYQVVLLERGTHPRFAIGESTTPLGNLSLERLARRYGLDDCHQLAAHGRWLGAYPALRRGLKRGFTFYRHHAGALADPARLASERLLVAASPDAAVADSHWLRADVDHHFVLQAIAAGVDYRERANLEDVAATASGVRLAGRQRECGFEIDADFVVDASGPGSPVARHLSIPSGLRRTATRSAVLFSHFTDVRLISDVYSGLAHGPYPDDWAAVHHLIDEGWMYSLRFDHGVTSAGFALRASGRGRQSGAPTSAGESETLWRGLLASYPTLGVLFENAKPLFSPVYRPLIQHRLARAVGPRWALLPHAYAFVDPLFSTGIAWSLRAVERLAIAFEAGRGTRGMPAPDELARYDALLAAEADQIDRLVAGAYDAMAHFDLFAAHAMIYFASVAFSEVGQRLRAADDVAWTGFLGVGDPVLEPLPAASLRRLRRITRDGTRPGTTEERGGYVEWVQRAIAPRNIAGFADPARANLYPVDLDMLIERHELLGMTRDEVIAGLPALRGVAPSRPAPDTPAFTNP